MHARQHLTFRCRRCHPCTQAPAAAGEGEDADGAANAAADAAVQSGQLPKEDDGVSCLLLRLPKGWGPPRLQAFIERFGAKPASVSKNAGEDWHAAVLCCAMLSGRLFDRRTILVWV